MRAITILSIAILLSSAMASIDDDIFSMDDIFGRGLLQGSSSTTATALPTGTVKYTVTLSFSGAAPTGTALETFKMNLAAKMAADLFKGKVDASAITITVSSGRRRLLAFSATGSITSNQATIDEVKTLFSTNKAAFETAVKADTTLSAYGYTGVSANTASYASMTTLAAVTTCAIMVMAI